jgi:predicted acylesterase/phospholipase RssA
MSSAENNKARYQETAEHADNAEEEDARQKMPPVIEHIVISGGLTYGLCFYGCIKQLSKTDFWNYDNIRTFYATSAGTVISTIIALNFDWDTLDDYLIKRPWNEVFNIDLYSILGGFDNMGIISIDAIREIFIPLFGAKDISIDITLNEFYELTKKELHYFTIRISDFELIDLNYRTHPDWTVIEAMYASSAAPIVFSPFIKNGEIYTDGGLMGYFPLKFCMESEFRPKPAEVLGINKIQNNQHTRMSRMFAPEANLYDYINTLLEKIVNKLTINNPVIPLNVSIEQNEISSRDLYNVVNSKDMRLKLIDHGANCANRFISAMSDQEI